MQIKVTDSPLFQFSPPEFSFGQLVKTCDGYIGYVVGLDFYPETRTWSYGIYIKHQPHSTVEVVVEETWYEAEQLQAIAQLPDSCNESRSQSSFNSAREFAKELIGCKIKVAIKAARKRQRSYKIRHFCTHSY